MHYRPHVNVSFFTKSLLLVYLTAEQGEGFIPRLQPFTYTPTFEN
jgi:hypothetical protein